MDWIISGAVCCFAIEIAQGFNLIYTIVHMRQISLLKKQKSAFGGSLLTTRAERARRRPLSTRDSMHLVLRSTKAKGEWSFRAKSNPGKIANLLKRFSSKYGVRIYSVANVGNHLHIHVKLSNRFTYAPFIRALSGAIALAVTGASKVNKLKVKFWDYRPYSRVVESYRGFLQLKDYIRINQYEGCGYTRKQARFYMGWEDILSSISTA